MGYLVPQRPPIWKFFLNEGNFRRCKLCGVLLKGKYYSSAKWHMSGAISSQDLKFVETTPGRRYILLHGYTFRLKSKRGSTCYWVCCESKCRARGIFAKGAFRLTHSEHLHEPNTAGIKEIRTPPEVTKPALNTNSPEISSANKPSQVKDTENSVEKSQLPRSEIKQRHGLQSQMMSGGVFTQEDFQFIENNSGGYFISLRGYTYRRKSRAGSKCYWICTAPHCPGRGVLCNGTFRLTHSQHAHGPSTSNVEEIQTLSKLKKLALTRDCRGNDLLKELNIVNHKERYLAAIRSWRSRNRKKLCLQSLVIPVGTNYKLLRSPKSSKNMISHSGFVYRLDLTTKPDSLGKSVKYWRCRRANCKSRAKTDSQGNLYILQPGHNHSPEDEDERKNIYPQETVDILDVKQTGRVPEYLKMKLDETLSMGNLQDLPSPNPPTNFSYCSSAADAETYSIEKLMADNMEENYGVTAAELHTINLDLNRKDM